MPIEGSMTMKPIDVGIGAPTHLAAPIFAGIMLKEAQKVWPVRTGRSKAGLGVSLPGYIKGRESSVKLKPSFDIGFTLLDGFTYKAKADINANIPAGVIGDARTRVQIVKLTGTENYTPYVAKNIGLKDYLESMLPKMVRRAEATLLVGEVALIAAQVVSIEGLTSGGIAIAKGVVRRKKGIQKVTKRGYNGKITGGFNPIKTSKDAYKKARYG